MKELNNIQQKCLKCNYRNGNNCTRGKFELCIYHKDLEKIYNKIYQNVNAMFKKAICNNSPTLEDIFKYLDNSRLIDSDKQNILSYFGLTGNYLSYKKKEETKC